MFARILLNILGWKAAEQYVILILILILIIRILILVPSGITRNAKSMELRSDHHGALSMGISSQSIHEKTHQPMTHFCCVMQKSCVLFEPLGSFRIQSQF
jgi:hypothetical protein